jgi:hypothetical protein
MGEFGTKTFVRETSGRVWVVSSDERPDALVHGAKIHGVYTAKTSAEKCARHASKTHKRRKVLVVMQPITLAHL